MKKLFLVFMLAFVILAPSSLSNSKSLVAEEDEHPPYSSPYIEDV